MSADAKVFAGCCVIAALAIGIEIGKDNKPLLCPVVAGHEVVSTVAPDTCVYAQTLYGRALRKSRATKS
jgi:hypothetical protein